MPLKNIMLFLFLIASNFSKAQNPVLIGYWQNWNDSAAPYIALDNMDPRYSVICVSFAVPTSPSDMNMVFTPDSGTTAGFALQIQALQSQGKKVLLSVGGATTSVSLNNTPNHDAFVNSMTALLTTYHFDGIDIDIEHGNSIMASGTISTPLSADSINLIAAINQIKTNYFNLYNTRMMLTFAPETAYVQGGMSAYGGIWGGYLPILDALRNDIDFIHVQLYNSGSMYGINGMVYNQGTADFIVSMTEAMIIGFNTSGGIFAGFPANKIVVGLPACPSSAGGGFVSTSVVASAVNYLIGSGPQPGSYTLSQPGGYPNLGGMMTWSINWDKVNSCNSTAYQYAANFESLFEPVLSSNSFLNIKTFEIAPNPVTRELLLKGYVQNGHYQILNLAGQLIQEGQNNDKISVDVLASGIYLIKYDGVVKKFLKH